MRQPRTILLYTHALTGGGAERVWALLASGLARRGHDVLFATDFEAPQNQGFIDARVRRVTLGGNHAISAFRLSRLIRREKPDVTISALSATNLKHAIAAALAGRRQHAILSHHGYASSEPQPLSRIGFMATAVISRLTAATICVSDGLLDYVVQHWRADAAKTLRIYNPVDGGPLAAAASIAELKARGPVVLSAGRFVSYKQFPSLIRAFARVTQKDARLIILGEGPQQSQIDAEIDRLGLRDRVVLPGYVSAPWEYYARASCFALASSQEPFGLVVVEALANGLPIVATDCAGPREILDGGRIGTLTPLDDEESLARAIDAAIADPGDPKPRVERAQLFSLERGLDEYEALIANVIDRSATRYSKPLMLPQARGFAGGEISQTMPSQRAADVKNPLGRKILLYTHSLTGGGAERAFALLASGLARAGHEVIFATDYSSADNDAYLDRSIRRITLGRGHLRSTIKLTRLLQSEKPDVSMSAMGASNLKHALAALIGGARKRAIVTYHGFFESEPKILSRLSFVLTPLITRLTARTVAVSKTLRKNLVDTWRADPRRTCRIYNPIAWGAQTKPLTEADLKNRTPVVLASGRLTPLKNFDCLVRAFATVHPSNARLIILGEGPERERLQTEIARLGLQDRVEMPGYVEEPWSYYAQAACLAVTSKSESFGMVVVEALAHGLAVVSSDCKGPNEILCDGRYGRIVPYNDEAALAGALSAALADRGDPAQRIARAMKYLPENSIAHYERLIEDVCEEASALAPKATPATA